MTGAPRPSASARAAATTPATPTRWPRALPSRTPTATSRSPTASSHIQSIAFLKGGRVNARTILTYGQSENPRSPYSSDQTRFGAGRWVHFAWTRKQIRKDLVETLVVRGSRR
ncbi:MAG: penicillin acylase family protein [Nocardioides sp.]